MTRTLKERIEKAAALPEPHEATALAVYAGHQFENDRLAPLIAALAECAEALEFYTKFDNETARHMDTEFMQSSRVGIVRPIEKIGQ